MENVAVTATQLPKQSVTPKLRDGFLIPGSSHQSPATEYPFSPPPPPGMNGYGSQQPMEGYNRPVGGGNVESKSPRYDTRNLSQRQHVPQTQFGYEPSSDGYGKGSGRKVRIEEAVADSMDRDEEFKRQGTVERQLLERDLQEKVFVLP